MNKLIFALGLAFGVSGLMACGGAENDEQSYEALIARPTSGTTVGYVDSRTCSVWECLDQCIGYMGDAKAGYCARVCNADPRCI